ERGAAYSLDVKCTKLTPDRSWAPPRLSPGCAGATHVRHAGESRHPGSKGLSGLLSGEDAGDQLAQHLRVEGLLHVRGDVRRHFEQVAHLLALGGQDEDRDALGLPLAL